MKDVSHITLTFVFQMMLFAIYTIYFIFTCKKKIKDKEKAHRIWIATAVLLFVVLFALQ